ncbi:PAS domain S-box protein [Mucilaginibacter ginsenosidivorax]|uniref:histidine kinase n=1 Tax=Mucilaginibacter ginsenosidivorax TaxID=862126 RepID=A0A5B8VZQ3_9SPHI|nr:PAS domain S-box protein [Mucilaginibacter ginsenosidivorax]QEC76873.1 PAS domain S-box protein [Mucilaginibacter ginsenosidivorax]
MPINTIAPTTDCIIIFDTDEQRYLFISPAIINILGITAAQLLSNNSLWFDMISETQRGGIETAVASLDINESVELNYLINTPQNTTRAIIDKKNLVIDEATNHKVLVSTISVQTQPTAGNATEDSLFSDLFYKNANPVWIVDKQTLCFLKVNHAATVHYGYTEDEFLLLTLSDIRPPEEIGSLKTYLSENENFEISADDFNRAGIWKHSSKSGQIIYADVNWFGIKYKGRNCILSIATDVTAKLQYQDEARRREQFLNSLIDSQTNFLIRIDIKGRFSFVNKQFLKTFGYNATELIGQHFAITTIPQELHLCEEAFVNCVSNPGKIVKLLHKKPDVWGGLHDTDWEFISITNDSGQVCEVQGIGQDITAKLKIEREIKEAAEKLDAFIESITDSFFIIDNEWRFVKVNSAFEKMTNTPREEMLGNVLWDVYPEIMDSGFGRAYYEMIEKRESVKFTEYFEPIDRWLSTSAYPSAEGITIYVKDISDERRAQEEAHWTKTSLEALINNTHDHIWSVDREMRYVYMNDAYIRETTHLTGVEPIAGAHSYLHKGYSEEIHNEWVAYYSRALLGEQYTIINESIDRQTKTPLYFEVSFNPIYTQQGDIIGVGCFARDITRRLKIEQELIDQNERLRNIASLSSHEIRRPVASMMGLISIMDKENFFNPENEQIIQHLFTVSAEIDDVIRLIVDSTFTSHG